MIVNIKDLEGRVDAAFPFEKTKENKTTLLEFLLNHDVIMENPCNGKGTCKKCECLLDGEKVLACQVELEQYVEEKQNLGKSEITVTLLEKKGKAQVLHEGFVPDFERDDMFGFGFAIDIGTTTVVCSLVDLETGEEVATASNINAQKIYGLDVLTRITYELEHPEDGIARLQKAIVDSLNEMMKECVKQVSGLAIINRIVVAANCTMLHMLLGVDATSLGRAPYKPIFVKAQTRKAGELGLHVLPGDENVEVYCLPSVSAYIGADIVAGAYVCDLRRKTGNSLFIDIGTNGEIVLSRAGKLYCCSCAAGPALEGMNISAGMRAATGAIEDLVIGEDGVSLKVIGCDEPFIATENSVNLEGICGSGILAGVKELLRVGLVKKSGVFVKLEDLSQDDYRLKYLELDGKKRQFYMGSDKSGKKLYITQDDVRQVQLAKGAILSGFLALLEKAGITMEELDEVIVAGQFGAHLPVESLVGSGILPEEVSDKVKYVGNTSKTGAYMVLLSSKVQEEIESVADDMFYFELAEVEGYEQLLAKAMKF